MTDLLTTYHNRLAACLWPHQIETADIAFRKSIDGEVPPALDRILTAHRRRTAGKSSPVECERILRELAGR